MPPAAFNRNTAATEKKKREVELARILNEMHLTGALTAECDEAKELTKGYHEISVVVSRRFG